MNKVILMGRLANEPDFRQTQEGTAVCSFRLAVKRPHVKDKSDFISCVAWRNTAEFVNKYFTKGQQVAVEGSIQTRDYTDNQGIKRYVTEIVAEQVYFADTKKEQSMDSTFENSMPEYTQSDDIEDIPFN